MSLTVPLDEIFNFQHDILVNNPSWKVMKIADIAELLNGFAFESTNFSSSDGIPLIRIRDITNDSTETNFRGAYDPKYLVNKGDLLIGMDGQFRCCRWTGPKGLLNQRVCKITPNTNLILEDFFFYQLNDGLKRIENVTSSVTVGHLSSRDIINIPILIPPYSIQPKINDKLKNGASLVKDQQKINIRLERKLKMFRQAILAAAVTGKLTDVWREENSNIETASRLLEKIQAQRKVKSKAPSTGIDTQELSPLPDKWIYVFFGDVVDDFKYGTSEKSDYSYKGTPVLRIPNVISQKISIGDMKYLEKQETKEEYLAKDGDILIVRSNGSRDLVGKHALVSGLKGNYAFASYLIRIRPKVVLPAYMSILLNSNLVRQQLFSNSKSAAGINNINTQELASMIISLPPLKEQEAIIEKVNQYFEIANNVEKQIKNAEAKVSKLTQAILAKTFSHNID